MTLTAATYQAHADPRNGIFYQGVSPAPYCKCSTSATSYLVVDFTGVVVSSGVLSSQSVVTPTAPGGGWKCGWYFFAASGPDQGAPDHTAYGGGWFQVIPNDSRFLPTPAGDDNANSNGEGADLIASGVLGIGAARGIINSVQFPQLIFPELDFMSGMAADGQTWWTNPGSQYLDPARPRALWCLFSNGTVDAVELAAASGTFGHVFVADVSVPGEETYVDIGAGSVSGTKIRVYSPDTATVVETYDNLASPTAAATAINGVSTRIYFVPDSGTGVGSAPPRAIGRVTAPQNLSLSNFWLDIFCLDGTKAATTFVSTDVGTTAGTFKVQVFYPNSSTLVETYDNLADNAAAVTAISGVSTRIDVWQRYYATDGIEGPRSGLPGAYIPPTPLNNTMLNGTKHCVSVLYAAGFTRFEGPYNEPNLADGTIVQQFKLFIDAVHTVTGAKAIGPCSSTLTPLISFMPLCNARGIKPDELSTHAYDLPLELPQDRALFAQWVAAIVAAGWDDIPRWDTEMNFGATNVVGVLAPWFSVQALYRRQLREEAGIPREYAMPWFDVDHGFVSNFWEQGDGLLMPEAAMWRTLAAETWGALYNSRLVMPGIWDDIVCCWRYNASTGDRLWFLSPWMPSVTVTIATSATGALTIVDLWGNTSTVTVAGGKVTVTVAPGVYLEIPHGATASVSTVNGWSAVENAAGDAAAYKSAVVDGVLTGQITLPSMGGGHTSSTQAPSTVVLPLNPHHRLYRLLAYGTISSASAAGALVAFTVEASSDGGSTWVHQATVDTTANATSVARATPDTGLQTFWTQQAVFDVPLPVPLVGTTHLRISASVVSYGAWPDLTIANYFSQPTSNLISLRRVMAVADGVYPHRYIEQVLADGAIVLHPLGELDTASPMVNVTGLLADGLYYNHSGVILGQPAPAGMRDFTAAKFVAAQSGYAGSVFFDFTNATFGDNFTMEIWFLIPSLPANDTVLIDTGYRHMFLATTGQIYTDTCSAGNRVKPDQLWHHAVWVKNHANNHLYFDSIDVTGSVYNFTYSSDHDNSGVGINGDWGGLGGQHMDVTMCMGAIYAGPLSPAQVANHYYLGLWTGGTLQARSLAMVA